MKTYEWILLIFLPLTACDIEEPAIDIQEDKILIEDHYRYIIIGSDEVAQTVGLQLASMDHSKPVLVIQSDQCEKILESSDTLGPLEQQISDKFVECTQRLGYNFIDSGHIGQRVGLVYQNRTRENPRQETLLAVEPNLKLLTGVKILRILYNSAASAVLGVEIELNNSSAYVYVEDELIIAGRCLNDYKHVALASIMVEGVLMDVLMKTQLNMALSSPVVAPILYTKAIATLPQNPTILPVELFLRSPESDDDEPEPDASLRMIIGITNLDDHAWIGFIPSYYTDDPSNAPSDEQGMNVIAYVLKIAAAVANSDVFSELQLKPMDQRIKECAKFSGTSQFWTCYVNNKLKQFDKKVEVSRHNTTVVDKNFRVRGVKALRLLPFGLTVPFLNQQLQILFSNTEPVQAETVKPSVVVERLTTTSTRKPRTNSPTGKIGPLRQFINILRGIDKEAPKTLDIPLDV